MNHTPDEPISAEPSDGLVDGVAPDASEPTAEPIAKPANWKRWGPWGLGLGLVAGAVVLVFGGVADFSRASDHQRAEDLLIDEAAQLSAQYRDLDSTATAAERERVGLEAGRAGLRTRHAPAGTFIVEVVAPQSSFPLKQSEPIQEETRRPSPGVGLLATRGTLFKQPPTRSAS